MRYMFYGLFSDPKSLVMVIWFNWMFGTWSSEVRGQVKRGQILGWYLGIKKMPIVLRMTRGIQWCA